MSNSEDILFLMLRKTKLFNDAQLDQLRLEDRSIDESITETITRLGMASEEDFLRAMAKVTSLEYVDVSQSTKVDPLMLQKLPASSVFQYKIVPVSLEDNVLTIATNDPFNMTISDGLRLASGCQIEIVLCTAEKISKQAQKYYGIGGDTLEKMIEQGLYESIDSDDISKFDISDIGQDASIVRFVNQVISEADRRGATDIHIEPMEYELRIRYRIDGLLQKIDVPQALHKLQAAVISRVKVMANLDIAEKRMPMDGRIGIRANNKDIDIRVSTCPTIYGESISLRLLQKSGSVVRLEQLGLNERDDSIVKKAIHRPNGIVLVTGPTGSGKSTSLYAFLHEINTVDKRILTAEEPVEYEMPGINQVLVRPDIGLTFPKVLRSFLRQDPDIMMVGEIRDKETADIAIQASLTGHLVFSTLHTNDSAGAFARLIDMGIQPFLVASSVTVVLAQRLLRRLCPDCKQPILPDSTTLKAIGINPEDAAKRTIYESCGCELCGKSGFKGRGGIFEILNVSDRISQLVTEHRPTSIIKARAREEGMSTLREDGINKIFSGFTTIEEVLRVTEDQGE